jgi:integrase
MKAKKKRGRYGDGCVYPRSGGIYWITWYEVTRQPDGTTARMKHYASTKSTDKKHAQRILRAKLQSLGGRRLTPTDPEKITYEDLRENLLQYCLMKGRHSLKKNAAGEPTLNTLPRLDRFFGGWKASEITIVDLKRFRIEGKQEDPPLSDARLNRYMATLRKMLNQGVKDELITRAELPSYYPTVSEPNVAVGAVFITREWYDGLIKELKEPLRSALILAYHVGTRVEELNKIEWRDINFDTQTVLLRAEVTKTSEQRLIPLPSAFDRKRGQPNELVFPLGDCRERWRTACVKVGAGYYECRECGERCELRKCPTHGKLPTKKLRYHGALLRHCRHTAARNMADAGMDEKRRMATLGHRTSSMSLRYNIGREGDVARAREAIERFHRG